MFNKSLRSFSQLSNPSPELLRKLQVLNNPHRSKYLQFERQASLVMNRRHENKPYEAATEIGPFKQKKAEFIYQELQSLSIEEKLYFGYMLKRQVSNMDNEHNMFQIQKQDLEKVVNRPNQMLDSNKQRQQKVIADLMSIGEEGFRELFKASGNLIAGGSGGSSVQQESGEEQNQTQEEEKVAEKTHFDVELQAIDSAQKIKIIKEVRTLCGLGLKEAKEAVEKVPNMLGKQLTKEDADKMAEALQKLGCTVELK